MSCISRNRYPSVADRGGTPLLGLPARDPSHMSLVCSHRHSKQHTGLTEGQTTGGGGSLEQLKGVLYLLSESFRLQPTQVFMCFLKGPDYKLNY